MWGHLYITIIIFRHFLRKHSFHFREGLETSLCVLKELTIAEMWIFEPRTNKNSRRRDSGLRKSLTFEDSDLHTYQC